MHHSAGCVNTRCLRRSVRHCRCRGVPGRLVTALAWDFTGRVQLTHR
jgi:hypothetical protein